MMKRWTSSLVLLILLFSVTAYDLSISRFLTVHAFQPFCSFVEIIMILPAYLVMAYCCMNLLRREEKTFYFFLSLAFSFGAAFHVFGLTYWYLALISGIVLFFLMYALPAYEDAEKLKRAVRFIVILWLIVHVLKIVMGRTRFLYLDESHVFTPWFVMNGMSFSDNYNSFPSGHTASACTLLAVYRLTGRKNLKYMVCALIALTALGRVMAGMHYCSDTLFSMFTASVLYQLILKKDEVEVPH